MAKTNLTYEQAVKELEEIVKDLSSGKCDIDQLTVKIKRAKELLAFCKERLYKVSTEVNDILEK